MKDFFENTHEELSRPVVSLHHVPECLANVVAIDAVDAEVAHRVHPIKQVCIHYSRSRVVSRGSLSHTGQRGVPKVRTWHRNRRPGDCPAHVGRLDHHSVPR